MRRDFREAEPRQPDPIYALMEDAEGNIAECQICGEDADDEMGCFILPKPLIAPDGSEMATVIAHGQCGLDHGLELG